MNTRRRIALPEITDVQHADVVVVGAGIAGLTAAYNAARNGMRVTLVCKTSLGHGASRWAQGGIAAAIADGDSPAQHATDTITAGAGHCNENAVRTLTASAPGIVEQLLGLGVDFDVMAGGGLALAREGGHSQRRVVHAGGDATGAAIIASLLTAIRRESVNVVENAVAVDLELTAGGAVSGLSIASVDSCGAITGVDLIKAPQVVLATGGLGRLFARTTNPVEATGDGVAIAARAGATIHDLEFVQFHPTALLTAVDDQTTTLLTEALRGEGARILDERGTAVMEGRHPLGDLAPRDVVSTAMSEVMSERSVDNLWLDLRSLGGPALDSRFPTVAAICRAAGLDPAARPVPIAPAAHYSCGGVTADLDGVTSVPGLYAVGEVACTGVHGANRLASNGLLEAVLTGSRVSESIAGYRAAISPPLDDDRAPAVIDSRLRGAIVAATSRYAGPLRTREGLQALATFLDSVETTDAPARSRSDLEATNAHLVASLLAESALARAESRGCHRRLDTADCA